MTDQPEIERELDAILIAARQQPQDLPDGLMQRVLADAERCMPAAQNDLRHDGGVQGGAPGGWFGQLSAALGGWTGLGGLTTACVAGLWIGYSPPSGWVDPVALVYSGVSAEASIDLFETTGFSDLMATEDEL